MKPYRLKKGCVHVYTGNGKGKTTAALGLALRAAGAGLRVFFTQFIKKGRYSEIKALEKFGRAVEVHQFGRGCFIRRNPEKADIELAVKGLRVVEEKMLSGDFDIVIMDEANCAVKAGLFTVERLLELILKRPKNVELVITGRNAHRKIIAAAGLVTEMREVKHYCSKGLNARKGIEF